MNSNFLIACGLAFATPCARTAGLTPRLDL